MADHPKGAILIRSIRLLFLSFLIAPTYHLFLAVETQAKGHYIV